jgi:EpsI family protein
MVACLGFLWTLEPAAPRMLRQPLATVPKSLGQWRGEDRDFPHAVTSVLRADDSLLRVHVGPDNRMVWLFIGFWGHQADGVAAHSPKLCYPGAGWSPVEQGMSTISLADGSSHIEANQILFQKGRAKELVLYWYQIGRRVVASEYLGKYQLVYNSLWNRRADVAFVRISTDVIGGDNGNALQRLQDVARHLAPELDARLPL